MDQALINIRGKQNKRLSFDFIANEGDCRAEEECACQSTKTQTNKLRTPSLLVYLKWTFQNNS